MGKQSSIKDKAVFVILCVVLIAVFLGWKSCGTHPGRPGLQQGALHWSEDNKSQSPPKMDGNDVGGTGTEKTGAGETKENKTEIKLYLGDRGVTEDQATWYDADQFADYIRQLQEKGVKEVKYSLLPDSIERLEKQWDAALKNANMKNYIEPD